MDNWAVGWTLAPCGRPATEPFTLGGLIKPPKCIVLQDEEGRYLGFLLLAIKGESLEGDCVFMIMPKDPEMFDAAIAQPLFARKDVGEFRVTLNHDTGWSASISGHDFPEFDIQLDASGSGSWRDADQYSGRALLPPAP